MNQMTPSRNSYLAHYGVKGMKWGVRNDDTKRKYRSQKKVGLDRDYDQTIRKGNALTRISDNPDADFKRSYTYVTRNPTDDLIYDAEAELFSDILNTTKMSMTPIKDLKIAGGKTATEAVLQAYGDKTLRELYKSTAGKTGRLEDYYDAVKSKELTTQAWNSVDLISRQDRGKAVVEALKKQKYSGMIDLADAYLWNGSETLRKKPYNPTIIFDPSDNLKVTKRQDFWDF